MIRVMVVEDFPIIREAISRALINDERIDLLASYGTAHALLDGLVGQVADVVLLDLHLPDMDGPTLIRRILRVCPAARIVVFTASEHPGLVRAALEAGAQGYTVKRQHETQVIEALVAVYEGGTALAPQIAAATMQGISCGDHSSCELRPHDLDLVRFVVAGQTDEQIAAEMFISTRSVQNHLARIREFAGVKRRPELARWAVENAIV